MMPPVRKCPRCGEEKPRDDFGTRKRPSGKTHSLPYCRACHVSYHKAWRNTPEGNAKFNRAELASKRRYPERERARNAVSRAIRQGLLNPAACVLEGGDCSGKIEAHHDDYSRPLDVVWVCRGHHRILDRQRRKVA